MNILKRKVQVKNHLPATYFNLAGQLVDIREAISTYLDIDLGFEITPDNIRQEPQFLGSDSFDAQKAKLAGLLFAIGGGDKESSTKSECQIFLEVSPSLANTIMKAKLGRQDGKNVGKPSNKVSNFTLFDVLIVQPLVERILNQLKKSGAGETIKISDRNLSIDDLGAVRFAKQENWLKLQFPILLKDDPASSAKAKKKSASSKSADKDIDGLSVSLYLTHQIAENILQAGQEKESLRLIDPDNPWSQHMRNTMLNASRPLEIVIEDLKLSVADCTRLELGQIISLPGASHERLNIKTKGHSGKIILTTATLGAFKSSKAVKLNEDIDPDFLGEPVIVNENDSAYAKEN